MSSEILVRSEALDMADTAVKDQADPLKLNGVHIYAKDRGGEHESLEQKISSQIETIQFTSPPTSEPIATYPKSRIGLIDRFVDEPRPLRVAVIGGGLSGVLAGILLPAKVPGIQLTIFEKNNDFVSESIVAIDAKSDKILGRDLA